MKRGFLFLWILLLCAGVRAQNAGLQKLDAYVDTLVRHDRLMGRLSLFREGRQIYSKCAGYADVEAKRVWDDATIGCVGSVSKTFTAALVFRAVEQGRLSLDQSVKSFFPFLPSDKITVAHLLSHRSGIRNYIDNDFSQWCAEAKSRAEMLSIIERCGCEFEPDARTSYSNSNYVLLSYMLETLYKKPYAEILDREIVKPLGLKNTGFGVAKKDRARSCKSYVYLDKWRVETRTDPSVLMGAGGVWSTPCDLNVFADALFSGRIVSGESLRRMTAVTGNMGMGLVRMPFYQHWGYGHSGGIDGFQAFFIYLPEQRIGCAIASNGLNFDKNEIVIAALSAVYDQPFTIPDFYPAALAAEDLDRYAGVYSSAQLPVKLTVSVNGPALVAQGTGQLPFVLEPMAKDRFRFAQAGIDIEFKLQSGTLVLRQGGGTFILTRE